MIYTFDKDIPYTFKDLTGVAEEHWTGWSIMEDGKPIGGIVYQIQEIVVPAELSIFIPEKNISCCAIPCIELLPEYRGKGIGTAIIKRLLEYYDCVHAAVQEERAWEWWKRMGAQPYAAMMFPQDAGKPDAKAHTLVFVLGRDKDKTTGYRGLFQYASSHDPSCKGAMTGTPPVDFSKNK